MTERDTYALQEVIRNANNFKRVKNAELYQKTNEPV